MRQRWAVLQASGLVALSLFTGFMAGQVTSCRRSGGEEETPIDPPVLPAPDRETFQLVIAHNDARLNEGLSELELSPLLSRAAQAHAKWMAENQQLSHVGQDGRRLIDRVQREGYVLSRVGENIARGQVSVSAVIADWMNSPPHRRNMLDPRYLQVGAGIARSHDGQRYWCVVFGTPRGMSAAEAEPVVVEIPPGLVATPE